jgi:hypothetical protein
MSEFLRKRQRALRNSVVGRLAPQFQTQCTRRDLNPHTLRYRNLKAPDGSSVAAIDRECPDTLGDDGQRRSMAATTELIRDTRDTGRMRDRIRLARAALRFIDKGRIDQARKALLTLLDAHDGHGE